MEKALIEFAGRLRRTGLLISPAEVLDAGRAVGEVGVEDRDLFQAALRATLVKRRRDIPVFDALFELFFSRNRTGEEPEGEGHPDPSGETAEALNQLLDIHRPEMSLVTELIMTGSFGQLTRMLTAAGRGLGLERLENRLQVGFYQRRLSREMNLDRVRGEAGEFLERLREQGLPEETADRMEALVEYNLVRLDEELRAFIRREMEQNRYLFIKRMQEESLAERNLANLSEREVAEMRPVVERLARMLKDRLSPRLRRAQKGRFDLKATFRKNVGLGGPLPHLLFKHKKPAKPQVVALCDVSNSVRNFSRFMLMFLYTLKEVVSRVRSYIFVGDLAEVTGLFGRREINEAVTLAAQGYGLSWMFRTDYGSALTQFCAEHLDSVGPKTTVFILGDGRNNYFDPRTEALARIRERAKKVIWLNPEPRPNWRLGDSAAETYKRYCTMMAECGNLKQLAHIIEEHLTI